MKAVEWPTTAKFMGLYDLLAVVAHALALLLYNTRLEFGRGRHLSGL